MKILVDKFVPYAAEALSAVAVPVVVDGRNLRAEDVEDAVGMIVRTRTRCDEKLLGGAKKLKFVGTATIGHDHIDRPWLASRGVHFTNAAGCNSRAVLQWVAATLAHLSKVQGWQPEERTLGVVGVGHVGSLVAEYAKSWGFTVLCSDPPRESAEGLGREDGFVPLEELAQRSDIVTLHTPLIYSSPNPTYHLADDLLLGAMHDGATLLNASRGEVTDTRALLQHAHRLTLCIDTWEGEPDAIDRRLLEVAEVATPHIAGYSVQGKANATAIVLRELGQVLDIPSLKDWYPQGVAPSQPRSIGWQEMCRTIEAHCDLEGESKRMKLHPEEFEHRRNSYPLREEYF